MTGNIRTGSPRLDERALRQGPVTQERLRSDLIRLGVREGMVLNVHSSLSRLGWVAGGAQAVVGALLQAVGPAGTLLMPAHSGQLSEPANWRQPPVPETWWPEIRAALPAFDPADPDPQHGRHRRAVSNLARSAPQRPSAGVACGARPPERLDDGEPPAGLPVR